MIGQVLKLKKPAGQCRLLWNNLIPGELFSIGWIGCHFTGWFSKGDNQLLTGIELKKMKLTDIWILVGFSGLVNGVSMDPGFLINVVEHQSTSGTKIC